MVASVNQVEYERIDILTQIIILRKYVGCIHDIMIDDNRKRYIFDNEIRYQFIYIGCVHDYNMSDISLYPVK